MCSEISWNIQIVAVMMFDKAKVEFLDINANFRTMTAVMRYLLLMIKQCDIDRLITII